MDYKEVVKMIEDSEKRVDEILKAARLDRHEKEPMSKERLEMILGYGLGALGMLLVFGFFFMMFYFGR